MLVAGIKMRNIERSVSNQVHLEQSLVFKGQVTKHEAVNGLWLVFIVMQLTN